MKHLGSATVARFAPRRAARIAILIALVAPGRAHGQGPQLPAVIGPAELSGAQRGGEVTVEAAEQYADVNGMSLVPRQHLRIVQPPLRVDGGIQVPAPDLERTCHHFIANLSREELAGLAGGRGVRLSSATPLAADLLRCGVPDLVMFDLTKVARVEPLDAIARGDIETMMRRPIPEAEWQRRVAANRHRASLRARFGAVPHDLVLLLVLRASVSIEQADGKPLSTHVGINEHIGWPLSTVLVPWDGKFVVRGATSPSNGLDLCYTWLDAHTDLPPVATVERSGVYSLKDLVARLDDSPPRRVLPELADERLYVTAGEYEDELLEEAIQRASGLLWRHDTAVPGGRVLSWHPAAVTAQPSLTQVLGPVARGFAETACEVGSPFTLTDFLSNHGQPVSIPWLDLTEEQRAWMLGRARSVRPAGDGSFASTAEHLDPEDLFDEVAGLELYLMFGIQQVAVVVDPTGTPTLVPLSGTGLGIRIGPELAAALKEAGA